MSRQAIILNALTKMCPFNPINLIEEAGHLPPVFGGQVGEHFRTKVFLSAAPMVENANCWDLVLR